MADETTSYSATMDTATKVRRPPSVARVVYTVTLGLVVLVTLGGAILSQECEKAVADNQLKDLPVPTELLLALIRILKDPVWLAVIICGCVFLILLAVKGVLDVLLKFLIGLNFLWLIVFVLATAVTWSAMAKYLGKGEKPKSAVPARVSAA